MDVKLMASVSDCLDKYKVFLIEQLVEATDGFHESCLIQGSVYKGSINGEKERETPRVLEREVQDLIGAKGKRALKP
ncbi:hypothetical protein RJT34_31320 [Clitoria ternatea]|uniref:Uncharacterized protein n=1 Tax=Clitoria ternatea TaxID=43366 RepID=A0AAN9I899_CLITE